MKTRLLSDNGDHRTLAVVFATGDEVMDGLLRFAAGRTLAAASFTAIGASEQVTLGYFDVERREYKRILLGEQVAVLSLLGNVALGPDGPRIHAHVVVGRSDGTASGGHLLGRACAPRWR